MRKMTVNLRLEKIKILVIGESFTWEWIPQSSGSTDKAGRVEIPSLQWNTKKMKAVRYNVCFIVSRQD